MKADIKQHLSYLIPGNELWLKAPSFHLACFLSAYLKRTTDIGNFNKTYELGLIFGGTASNKGTSDRVGVA